jgi:RND family efflux transporter MFP subunit
MNRRRNLILVISGIAIVIALGLFSAVRPHAPAASVRIDTVTAATFTTTLPETGIVQQPRTQVLPALVGGNIGTIAVRPGERVRANQVVATIVNPQVDSSLATAQSAYDAAAARAQSAVETNSALPAQNRSQVVQAQANLQSANVSLSQARQDLASGQQSGLGYGGTTAEDQRVTADAAVAKADTDLREAQRVYDADNDLYAQKALSRDALDQAKARLDEARVTDDQTRRQREILGGSLSRARSVLADRVHAEEESVRQAQAALAAAEANASESRSGDVGAAQGDAARAAADLSFARDQVNRLVIRAPFAGIVQTIATESNDTLRPLQPGDPIQPGQPVATIAADRAFVVRTKVDEQDVATIALGQRARVSGEDFGDKVLSGHVSEISPVAQKSDDPSNTARQVITTVTLDRTLPFLRDGMTVDVDIVTKEVRHALAISDDAIRHGPDGKPYVFVVVGGKAHKTPVVTGASNDTSTVVTQGLRPGDRIVADTNAAVADGSVVKPAPSPSPLLRATATPR